MPASSGIQTTRASSLGGFWP